MMWWWCVQYKNLYRLAKPIYARLGNLTEK